MPVIDQFSGEYRFLSNFHYVVIEYEGLRYLSTEHAFQAAKSLDHDERVKIRDAKTPGIAKRLGRQVTMRKDWNSIRIRVMEEVLRLKFAYPHLAEWLLATGDAQLIEGNTWNDTFWGVCNGQGQNNLGKLLMKIRKELRDAAQTNRA